jgi:general secretion pathway protein D
MAIEQTVDSVAGEVEIDGNKQPLIGRREATSTITVDSGQVIILGGLQENRRGDSSSYFPILGKLPLVNKILGGESTDYNRTDLIIFIRPTVLKNSADAARVTEQHISILDEGHSVRKYLKSGSTGNIYMEGSKFEKEHLEIESTSDVLEIEDSTFEKEEPQATTQPATRNSRSLRRTR